MNHLEGLLKEKRENVHPARAGLNPKLAARLHLLQRHPRARGDEPHTRSGGRGTGRAALHVRGERGTGHASNQSVGTLLAYAGRRKPKGSGTTGLAADGVTRHARG